MMLADFIHDLERLKGIGIAPMLGILLLFVLGLAGVVGTLAVFGFKFFLGERRRHDKLLAERDEERDEHRAEVDRRLKDCEDDREDLRERVDEMAGQVAQLTNCPRRNCPLRRPPAGPSTSEGG